jgi:hypothetical protein
VLLDAYGLVVEGNMELPKLIVDGGNLVFYNASCRRFDATGAQLTGAGLDLRNATVHGDVDLEGPYVRQPAGGD